jgi:hypothetical protein
VTKEPEDRHRKVIKNDTSHQHKLDKTELSEDDIERHKKIPPRHRGEYVYTPGKTELTEEDIDDAIAEWDRLMPENRGLLDANIEKRNDD